MARGNPLAGRGDDKKVKRESAFETLSRKRQNYGVNWADVDEVSVKAAIATAIAADVALMFTGAAGGTGLCITIWVDGQRFKQYANSAEEASELLDAITDAYSSGAEDIRSTVRGVTVVQGGPSNG